MINSLHFLCKKTRLFGVAFKKLFGMEEFRDEQNRRREDYPAAYSMLWIFAGLTILGILILGPQFNITNLFLFLLGTLAISHMDKFVEVLVSE